jgi:hypothetical protein
VLHAVVPALLALVVDLGGLDTLEVELHLRDVGPLGLGVLLAVVRDVVGGVPDAPGVAAALPVHVGVHLADLVPGVGVCGGLGRRTVQAPGVHPEEERGRVGRGLHQQAVLEELQAVAGLADDLADLVPGRGGPVEGHALGGGDVRAVLRRGGGLVAAGRADREGHVAAHGGAGDVAVHDLGGQLGEAEGVHLHQDLDPVVLGPVAVGVLVQRGVDDHAPGALVVVVVVVDEDRLALEARVRLLQLLGGELVEVVVAAAGDGP